MILRELHTDDCGDVRQLLLRFRRNAFRLTVTPSVATYIYSQLQGKNRNLVPQAAERYAASMEAGLFSEDTMIAFDEAGNLVDGQHRILAQIFAGATVTYVVLPGRTEEEIKRMDCGKVRDPAAIASTYCGFHRGCIQIIRAALFSSGSFEPKLMVHQHERILGLIGAEAEVVRIHARRKGLTTGHPGALLRAYIFLPERRDEILQFADCVRLGEFRGSTDPANKLVRRWLQGEGMGRMQLDSARTGSAAARGAIFIDTAFALNKALNGKRICNWRVPCGFSVDELWPLSPDIEAFREDVISQSGRWGSVASISRKLKKGQAKDGARRDSIS